MTEQMQFDAPETPEERMRRETNEAIDRVERHANQDWKDAAYIIGCQLAKGGKVFISDDFWPLLEELGVKTHQPTALGATIRKLLRNDVILWTGIYRLSLRRHGTPMKEWKGTERDLLTPKYTA